MDSSSADPRQSGEGSPHPEREFTDLGFGSVVAQQARGRLLSHDGEPTGRKYGLGPQRLAHDYLALDPGVSRRRVRAAHARRPHQQALTR